MRPRAANLARQAAIPGDQSAFASGRPLAQKLPAGFYARPVLIVARECIGKVLVHRTPEGETAGRIVEAEAYRGPEDRAAHSWRGLTPRTAVMFGPPGTRLCLSALRRKLGIQYRDDGGRVARMRY